MQIGCPYACRTKWMEPDIRHSSEPGCNEESEFKRVEMSQMLMKFVTRCLYVTNNC